MKLSKVKIIILILAILSHCVFFVNQANAGMWGESFGAAAWQEMMDQLLAQIKAALLGAAKQAAVKMIDSQVDNLIGGSGSENAKFITNWQDYLFKQPAEKTKLYMNDWFDSVGGGRGSSSNYSSASSSGDYMSQIIKQTKDSLLNDQTPKSDIQEYTSDPTQPFAEGNWRAFNALISNPANNAFGLALAAQQEYLSKMETEQKKAETQAVAYQGYLATTEGGGTTSGGGSSNSTAEPTVTAPGSLTASIEANTKNMGNEAVVNAGSIPEVIISALVNKLLTKVLNQGIGSAQSNTQRQNNSNNDNSSSNNNSNSSSGFGSFLFNSQ